MGKPLRSSQMSLGSGIGGKGYHTIHVSYLLTVTSVITATKSTAMMVEQMLRIKPEG